MEMVSLLLLDPAGCSACLLYAE